MIVVELFCKGEIVWGGTMAVAPRTNEFITLAKPPEKKGDELPEPTVYRVIAVQYGVQQGYNINLAPIRLQVEEIDVHTGRAKTTIIQTPQTIH